MTLILIGGLRGVATRHVPSFQATAILASGSLGEGSPGMAALAAITTGFPALSFVLKERVFANAPALRVPAVQFFIATVSPRLQVRWCTCTRFSGKLLVWVFSEFSFQHVAPKKKNCSNGHSTVFL